MAWPVLEYSKKAVSRAGATLSDSNSTAEDKLNAIPIVNNWRSIHGYPINTFQATLRSKLSGVDDVAIVAQRLKRLPSIIKKLQRYPDMQLSRMQDVGGVRAVVKDIRAVRTLERKYLEGRLNHSLHSHYDYISSPKPSGYRSVHLIYRYSNPRETARAYNGLFIELQIRSKLQHAWATAVETVGTYLQESLKSSEGSKDWLNFFALVGSAFAHLEKCPTAKEYEDIEAQEVYRLVTDQAACMNVHETLQAFQIATDKISRARRSSAFHIILLNLDERTVRVLSYSKDELTKGNL
jgi:hypothetical protein